MEPNTSTIPVAENSTAAVLEHGHGHGQVQPSMHDPRLLPPPAFSPAASPGLLPGSGSSSWSQQIPPSPAVATGDDASSLLPMVGYDLFGNQEATPTILGGEEWEQGESSSSMMAALVLPECPSPGSFDFAAGELEAWPSEMSSCFFAPSSGGGGFAQPPPSDSELGPALRQSFAEKENPVVDGDGDAPLPPPAPIIEDEEVEEEEIDVSEFLVSDPEDQPPNASWTTAASPQMGGGGGGGASASWMAPASTGKNWLPAAASTCAMVSTSSGSTLCHSGGSSTMMKPSSSPVQPLTPPFLSQVAGAGSSNFNGFVQVQPCSSAVLALPAPNLHGPLLPVKQEVMESHADAAAARRHPDFISLVDEEEEEEDELYQDDVIGSPSSFAPCSWPGSSSNGSPSFAPGSWGGGGSGSSSIAPGSWGSSGGSPGFVPGSWGSSNSPSFAPGCWGGSSSSSPSFGPGSWGSSSSSPSFAGKMPCFDQSTSIDKYGSSSMAKLSMGGKMPLTSGLPPLPRAATSSRKGAAIVFTDPEMKIIAKEKKLQQLLRTDRKKVKRILYNRAYSAATKVRKVMHTKNLERMVVTLEERRKSLREELQSLQEGSAALRAQQMKMQRLIGELEQQTMLKDAVREVLRADIQKLNHLKLN